MKRLVPAVLLLLAPLAAQAESPRYAIVAGNNRGVERSAALRFAERDAERFAEVLTEVGGFPRGNVTLLQGSDAAQLRAALDSLDRRLKADPNGARAMVIFYFSGHADGMNLEIGADHIPFADLRRWIEGIPAGVKIAFVDSCLSGGLTQVKGGRLGPAFDITVTDTLDANGTAIVTSSARGEHSQESQELGGSFFTTYLISGFRGAADLNGDGKVTLAEVYQYAFGRTVAGTAGTVAGVQHPTYDFKIAGKGEVVLASAAPAACGLVLGPECAGTFIVLDPDRGEVAVEVNKPGGSRRAIALRPGRYVVTQQRGETWYAQTIEVAEGTPAGVDPSAMTAQTSVAALSKGNGKRRSGYEIMLNYGFSGGVLSSIGAAGQAIAGLRVNLGPISIVPRLSYTRANVDDRTLNMHYSMQTFSGESYVAWRFDLPFLDFLAGANLGVAYNMQSYANNSDYSGTAFVYGPAAGIDVPLGAGFSAQTFFEWDFYVLRVNNAFTQTNSPKGAFGLGYEF